MESTKFTPIQIVQRYYDRYLEYEQAFNSDPFDPTKLQEQLKEMVMAGAEVDSPQFEDAVVDLMVEKPARRADVTNSALKFQLFAEFYLATQEEKLPEELQKSYEDLSKITPVKPYHSIKDGKFIKNDDTPIKLEKDKLRALYKALQAENK